MRKSQDAGTLGVELSIFQEVNGSKNLMLKKFNISVIALLLVLSSSLLTAQDKHWNIGLSANRTAIEAFGVEANPAVAPTILYLAGLDGSSALSQELRSLLDSYAQLESLDRSVNLIVIPLANPQAEGLNFPPQGSAYKEEPVSNALWRWIGVHAPDLVVIAGEDEFGLGAALQSDAVAGFGSIPVQRYSTTTASLEFLTNNSSLSASPARDELNRRLSRSANEFSERLAQVYGQDFSTPAYVPGMGLIGRLGLGHVEQIAELTQGYVTGPEIDVSNASIMAGHLVFAEYAELTGDENYLNLALRAADLAFDEQGNMQPLMPMNAEMSDSIFMATPLLAKMGKLTGDDRYFAMAARHVEGMSDLLLRDDGLYRHSPLADVAWSRGNAFPALGLALSLSDFPEDHPAFAQLKASYQNLIQQLSAYQDADGMWHEVIDYPGSFAELSATAMIGIAIKRGIDRNWLARETYQPMLAKTWEAVLARSSLGGEFIDVCQSTGKMASLDAYLDRLAIFGRDDRAGGMLMLFANEMAGSQ